MPRRYLITLLLLIGLPLMAVAWLGVRVARDEQLRVREQFREALAEKLRETDQIVVRYFARRERELSQVMELPNFEAARLRELVRSEPSVRGIFVLDADGRLLFPSSSSGFNQSEAEFLKRAESVLLDKDLVRAAAAVGGARPVRNSGQAEPLEAHGWHVWYWGRGLNLMFWHRIESGQIVGVELDRSRWMADLIGELPETMTVDAESTLQARVRLVDAGGQAIYQWGDFEPDEEALPLAEVALSHPLESWRLHHFVDERSLAGAVSRGIYFPLVGGGLLIAVAVIGLGTSLYRESAREFREAQARVNFVNQVSHELKTPLTNIRLFADLLDGDLADAFDESEAAQPRERLDVIVAESQRLSRLIGNVLTFARQQQHPTEIRRRRGVFDDLVRAVLKHFSPAMAQRGIEVVFDGQADRAVWCDVDAVEQILVNLFSNVEKYAAHGRVMTVRTMLDGHHAVVWVADHGPGIRRSDREAIFAPFHRLSERLESPTGVGIGLSIARELARCHGGDVRLEDSDRGAVFRVDLDVSDPLAAADNAEHAKELP